MGQPGRGGITSTYLGRYLAWRRPTNRDHLRMPQRPLTASPTPMTLPIQLADGLGRLPISPGKTEATVPLESLLADTGTTALVVLHIVAISSGSSIQTVVRASG